MIVEVLREELNRRVIYDPNTGLFINKIDRNHNAKRGEITGVLRKDGYISLNILKKEILAHRAAWLLYYNELPQFLDHINTNRSDNRICNLRPATFEENTQNATCRSDNKLGIKGISYHPGGYYYCCIVKDKIRHKKYFKIADYLSQEQALERAIDWITTVRETLHNRFTNHGY